MNADLMANCCECNADSGTVHRQECSQHPAIFCLDVDALIYSVLAQQEGRTVAGAPLSESD